MQQILRKRLREWEEKKRMRATVEKSYDQDIDASSARTKMEVSFRVKNRLNGKILHSANFLFVIASRDVFLQFLIQRTKSKWAAALHVKVEAKEQKFNFYFRISIFIFLCVWFAFGAILMC